MKDEAADSQKRLRKLEGLVAEKTRLVEVVTKTVHKYESWLAELEARLQDAQRLNEGYTAVIGTLESRLANATAQLQDATAQMNRYRNTITVLEVQSNSGIAQGPNANQSNWVNDAASTRLEDLLKSYDLVSLAHIVKIKRLLIERDQSEQNAGEAGLAAAGSELPR